MSSHVWISVDSVIVNAMHTPEYKLTTSSVVAAVEEGGVLQNDDHNILHYSSAGLHSDLIIICMTCRLIIMEVCAGFKMCLGSFGLIYNLIHRIHATRPKAHVKHVDKLKSRVSELEKHLKAVEESKSQPKHLQQALTNLKMVLEDALEKLEKSQDMDWCKRFITNPDKHFEKLNTRLNECMQTLTQSVVIDTHAQMLKRREDEIDFSANLKDMSQSELL